MTYDMQLSETCLDLLFRPNIMLAVRSLLVRAMLCLVGRLKAGIG